jgi:hypothetical protein
LRVSATSDAGNRKREALGRAAIRSRSGGILLARRLLVRGWRNYHVFQMVSGCYDTRSFYMVDLSAQLIDMTRRTTFGTRGASLWCDRTTTDAALKRCAYPLVGSPRNIYREVGRSHEVRRESCFGAHASSLRQRICLIALLESTMTRSVLLFGSLGLALGEQPARLRI